MDKSEDFNLELEESFSNTATSHLEWKFMSDFPSQDDFFCYLAKYTHKMTTTHGVK